MNKFLRDLFLLEKGGEGIPNELLDRAEDLLGEEVPGQLVISVVALLFTWVIVLAWSVSNRSFLGLFLRCPPRERGGIDGNIVDTYNDVVEHANVYRRNHWECQNSLVLHAVEKLEVGMMPHS